MTSPLPDHLKDRKHEDWIWPFSLIPRSWTAFSWGPPIQKWGTQRAFDGHGSPKPIGEPGTWQVSVYFEAPDWAFFFAWYIAFSGRVGEDGTFRHWRIGARYDDVDKYVQWPSLATRRFPAQGERDTTA